MNDKRKRHRGGRLLLLRGGALLLSAALLLLGGAVSASADVPRAAERRKTVTAVYLDGEEILAGECMLRNGITYVPLRKFCNRFADCRFAWDGRTQTATVRADGLSMTVEQGEVYITANGHAYYAVGEVLNEAGSLYVPIRPLARGFNLSLSWNAQERCVELSAADRTRPFVAWADYDADELYWLSRIISAESAGEPLEGQIAVGNVVLNRVRSRAYPNTIYGVIFDRKHGTQFSPVSYGTIYNPPAASSVIAAQICLEGYTLSEEILFFMNPRLATTSWISENRPFAFCIGNHEFYY